MHTLDKIRQALGNRKSTLSHSSTGQTFVNLPEQSFEVLPTDSVDDIKAKLRNPFEGQSMSITGAANLAGTIKDRINAAKSKIAEVTQNTDSALAQLNDAADRGDRIAKQIEAEAADLNAQLGQFTNE